MAQKSRKKSKRKKDTSTRDLWIAVAVIGIFVVGVIFAVIFTNGLSGSASDNSTHQHTDNCNH